MRGRVSSWVFGRARHLELGVPLIQRALQLRDLGQPRGFRVGRRRHVGDELRLLDTQRLVLPGQLLGAPYMCARIGDGGGEKEVSRSATSPAAWHKQAVEGGYLAVRGGGGQGPPGDGQFPLARPHLRGELVGLLREVGLLAFQLLHAGGSFLHVVQ